MCRVYFGKKNPSGFIGSIIKSHNSGIHFIYIVVKYLHCHIVTRYLSFVINKLFLYRLKTCHPFLIIVCYKPEHLKFGPRTWLHSFVSVSHFILSSFVSLCLVLWYLALPCFWPVPCCPWLCFVLLVAVCWWLSVLSPVWGTQGWRSVPPASLQPSTGPWLTLWTTHAPGPLGTPEQGTAPMHPGPFGEWEQVCILEQTQGCKEPGAP